MPSKHDPADCLTDMLDNIERIGAYSAGLSRAAFERDGLRRDAVERCLERICEAAVRLGDLPVLAKDVRRALERLRDGDP